MIRAVSAPVRLLSRRSRHVAAVREHKTSTQLTSMEPFNPFAARTCRDCLLVQPRDVSGGSVNFRNTLITRPAPMPGSMKRDARSKQRPAWFASADTGPIPPEGRNHRPSLFEPARTQLVFRRDVPRDGAIAGHRVQFPGGIRRGVLCQKNRTLTAIAT